MRKVPVGASVRRANVLMKREEVLHSRVDADKHTTSAKWLKTRLKARKVKSIVR